jgi:hypothetical protein
MATVPDKITSALKGKDQFPPQRHVPEERHEKIARDSQLSLLRGERWAESSQSVGPVQL